MEMKTPIAVLTVAACFSFVYMGHAEETNSDSPTTRTTPVVQNEPFSPLTCWRNIHDSDFFQDYISGSLEVGMRVLYIKLLDNTKGEPFDGSFVGSVNELKAKQSYFPKPYIQYVRSWLGAGLGYHSFEFEAYDPQGSDGTAKLKGPLFYALARYPNESILTPFAEIGFALYSASFEAESNWGKRNRFDLDNATGTFFALGCKAHVTENLCAEAYLRHMSVDVDGTYQFLGDNRPDTPFTFTASHIAVGIGACYTF